MDEAEPQPYPRDGGHPHWSRALLQTKEHLSIYKTKLPQAGKLSLVVLSAQRQTASCVQETSGNGKSREGSQRDLPMPLIPVFKATVVLVSDKKCIETALQMIQFFNN